MEEDNQIIKIPGKHGEIYLIVPNRKPTEEEWNQLHRTMAEVIAKEKKIKESIKAAKY